MLIVLFWVFAFVLALIPGVIIGAIIGRYRPSRLLCILIAVATGMFASATFYPEPSAKGHVQNLVGFFPPFAAVLLLGHRFGRRRRLKLSRAADVT